jgi:hypothetical protein
MWHRNLMFLVMFLGGTSGLLWQREFWMTFNDGDLIRDRLGQPY